MDTLARKDRRHALAFVAALALTFLLMRFPGHPRELAVGHLASWPLELPLVALVLASARGRWHTLFRSALIAVLGALVLLRLGDLGSQLAFGRAFSPLAELHLVAQGWTLAAGTIGRVEAGLVVGAALVALALLVIAVFRGFGGVLRLDAPSRRRLRAGSAVALVLGVVAWGAQSVSGRDLGVRADLAHELVERVARVRHAVADQVEFASLLANDPLADGAPPTFAALAGRDVVVLFVESYGRSYVDAPRFAGRAERTFEALDDALADADLSVASGWLEAPIRGGRSWLAQATLVSGLPLTNHARFDRLLASERRSLHRLFGDAGWRTAAVLPIVRGPWREGAWYGVDRFHDGPSLGYAGRGFGYVPMPDQYTLAAFERDVREADARPVFATVGLLGSHAPWTPLARAVPWETIGDGRVFDGTNRFGEPLSWADPEPVREMYATSVELTLARVGEYLARHADDALFVVLGDHQPADVIAGWSATGHVPVHVVARDPRLLARLPMSHFSAGMRPADGMPALPMAGVRELLGRAFEGRADAGEVADVRP